MKKENQNELWKMKYDTEMEMKMENGKWKNWKLKMRNEKWN